MKEFKIKIIDRIIIVVALIVLVVFYYIKIIDKYITPILNRYAESETVMISTYIINESVKSILNSEDIDNIIKTSLNNDNEIISVDFNTNRINNLLFVITENIQTHIKKLEHNVLNEMSNYNIYLKDSGIVYYIPIGVIMNNPILSSLGPKIPVYASLIGDTTTNIKTEITEYGINNSLVKVYVSVEINEEVILPFTTDKITIKKDILLGMKLINGIVPDYYGNGITLESPLVSK